MDFSFTEEQDAVRELARQIFEGQLTQERLKELEGAGEHIDHRVWSELAKANLLGIALPESVGGSGLGIIELLLILEQVGRTAAPVPVLATLLMGAAPLAEFGTDGQQQRLLPGVVSGERVLTAALVEAGAEPHRAGDDGAARR